MNSPIYVHLRPGDTPPEPLKASPYRAILVVEADATAEWQDIVSAWLVRSGCRYLMAWGQNCSTWHDCVDMANLRAFDFEEIPDDDFVMTTWHSDEPLEEVFWFSEHAAAHPTLPLDDSYIIHIAQNERSAELLEMFRKARELDEDGGR